LLTSTHTAYDDGELKRMYTKHVATYIP